MAEKVRKQKPIEDAAMPREDKCSSRRLNVKPKEEKAAVEVASRAVRKKNEEKSGRAGGRSEVRCFSAACVKGPSSSTVSAYAELCAITCACSRLLVDLSPRLAVVLVIEDEAL